MNISTSFAEKNYRKLSTACQNKNIVFPLVFNFSFKKTIGNEQFSIIKSTKLIYNNSKKKLLPYEHRNRIAKRKYI